MLDKEKELEELKRQVEEQIEKKNKLKDDIVDDDIVDDDIVDDDIVDDDDDDDDDDDPVVKTIDPEDSTDEPDDEATVYFKFNTTNHKMEGKHRLKRDTIFHGKLDEENEDDMYSSTSDYYNKDFPIEKGTMFEMESRNYEDLETQRRLKKDIYDLLTKNTDLDFTSNRRKPNKQAFNNYYQMLLKELNNRYTKSEIFVELSYYFTDHIFNMYKLLYPEHATNIIMELRDKGYLNELDDMKFV